MKEVARLDAMWMNVEAYCKLRYQTDKPTKAQMNSVYNGLRAGTIPGAKHGGRWLVRLEVTNAKVN